MPCRDYYSDTNDNTVSEWQYRELKARADMLARIACKSLTELEANGIAELLLLRDDEVREWWLQHKEDDRKEHERLRKEAEKKAAAAERKRKKAELLARLTPEEKRILGIKE